VPVSAPALLDVLGHCGVGLQVLADMVHDQKIEENVKDLQAQLKALLEEVVGELPKLKVSFEENKELAALRAQCKEQEAELAKSKSLCDSQEDLIKQLKEQLAASQKELSDTKEKDAKIIEDKDREIAELKKQLRDLKTDDDAKIAELAAQIEELKKKLAAADERGNKEEAEKNRWKGEKESLDGVLKMKDDAIELLKKQLAALEKSLTETKAALELDESELKKDRELLLKDKELLAAKDAEIEDLKKKLAAIEQELKKSKEKVKTHSAPPLTPILLYHVCIVRRARARAHRVLLRCTVCLDLTPLRLMGCRRFRISRPRTALLPSAMLRSRSSRRGSLFSRKS
jgi:chromosome segregation ATPase